MLTINNTLDGYAKDVEILGNTTQDSENLADIRSVGDTVEGQELYEIPVLSRGKNLFNGKWERGYALNLEPSSPLYGKTQVGENYSTTQDFIKVSPNETYYFTDTTAQRWVVFYDKDKKPISHDQRWTNCVTPNNTAYIKFYDHNTRVDAFPNYSVSTIDNVYEPYVEDKLTILSPTPLEKVGDVADRIICKDGVWGVEKNIKTVYTKEFANVSIYEDKKDTYLWKVYIDTKNTNVMSNFAPTGTLFTEPTQTQVVIYDHTVKRELRLAFKKSDFPNFSDVSNVREYLRDNDKYIKIVQDAQFIPLPHSQQIKLRTFANKTNISFGCEIEGTIKAQVPKSLGATVNTHTEQINNLNKELDRVKKLEESTVSTVTTESGFTTVEATSNGYFEDVKLQGKTLVNLALPGINPIYFNINMFKTPCEYTVAITFDSNKSCTLWVEQVDTWKYVYRNDSVQQGGNYVVFKFNSTDFDLTKSFALSNRVSGVYDSTVVYSNIKMVILEGDHTQNPPSYFEGLKSVGQSATISEDEVDEIVVSSVKGDGNLFDGQLEEVSIETTYNGKFGQLIPSSSDFCSHTKPFMIKPNTTYVVGINDTTRQALCFMYDYNMNPLNFEYGNGSKEFTTPSNARYCRVRFGLILTEAMNYEMYLIEKDSTDLTHQSDKKRLLYYNNETQTWEKPILREWDSIEKHADGKYYYHQRSAEVVLNGSDENWVKNLNISTDTYVVMHLQHQQIKPSNSRLDVICDKLVVWDYEVASGECISKYANGTEIVIRISTSKLSTQDVQGFKQWLQANNVTVVYQLAQEKVYECTNIDLITYANETNYVVESGAISPKTTLKVHNNISNVVSLLQKKVSLLESNITSYMITQNRLQLASTYSADSVTFKVDYFAEKSVNSYDDDLFNLILNNIIVGKENYDYDHMFNIIMDYASWSQISWDQFDILVGIMDLQHNPPIEPPIEEVPCETPEE